jgi:hypothetical protein
MRAKVYRGIDLLKLFGFRLCYPHAKTHKNADGLKELRVTQKELADKLNTSQSCIARLESGSYRYLSLSFLRRVDETLDVRPHVKFERLRPAH